MAGAPNVTSEVAAPAASGAPPGLSETEARARLPRDGGNTVPEGGGRSWWDIVRRNLFTFINIVLLVVGVVLVVMGLYRDALLASGLAVVNGLVGVFQEARAKRRLDHIALLNRSQATVVRDGVERSLDPEQIVRGDVLCLRAGDQVFADGTVVGDGALEMDESLLTGESDPVRKQAGDAISSGSYCVSGSGWYEAVRVGAENTAAVMTAGARAYRVPLTPLQVQVNLIVRLLLVLAAFFLVGVLLGSFMWGYPVEDTVLAAAVVLGIVPSGLFLMIVVTYSMGAVRLADRDALVQGTNAVESLSNVDIFCMDKTGTLTANKMVLAEVQPIGAKDADVRQMLGYFARSTSAGTKTSEAVATTCPGEKRPTTADVPFSSAYKWSGVSADSDGFRGVFALGAPEFLGPQLEPERDADGPLRAPDGWGDKGMRVLLFAHGTKPAPFGEANGLPALPPGVKPVAWLGFTDELRPNVDKALNGFRDAGITLKVISGDNPETVAALARQAGLSGDAQLISGLDLDGMDDQQFGEAAERTTVFGRVTPEQKQRLVASLRDNGHYVAMTGDGVNDVLSLKQANLGIAMQSGSQATRNAADIVLLHDSFGALPDAFREGQRIRRGLCRILELFLTRVFTVSLIILSVLVVEAGFPLSPAQISVLTLLTVGIPTFGIALWTRPGPPPRNLARRLLRFVLPASTLLALAAFGVYIGVYTLYDLDLPALRAGGTAATTMVPASDLASREALTHVLVLGGLVLVLFASPPGPWFAVVEDMDGDRRPAYLALAMVPIYAVILMVPALRQFFGLRGLGSIDFGIIVLVVLVWMYVLRWIWEANIFDRFFGYAEPERRRGDRVKVTG
ncbi:MAG: HAD-IC family P-type ATPase [Chloroflexota bacterium]|nr:HAD-IC family P-type ATPase [Chloroflexota bacterium]